MDSGLLTDIQPVKPINWRKGYAYKAMKTPGKSNMDLLDAVAIQSDILHFEEALPSLTEIFINYTKEATPEIQSVNS